MKVKEWVDGGLVLDGNIREGAIEAFDDLRYVEALTLLESMIEFDILNLIRIKMSDKGEYFDADNKTYNKYFTLRELDWRSILAKAVGIKVISEKERKQIADCHEVRNKILHRIIFRSYFGSIAYVSYFLVSTKEAKRTFGEMLDIDEILRVRAYTLLIHNEKKF